MARVHHPGRPGSRRAPEIITSECTSCEGARFVWKRFLKWEWLVRCPACEGKGVVHQVATEQPAVAPEAPPQPQAKPAAEAARPNRPTFGTGLSPVLSPLK